MAQAHSPKHGLRSPAVAGEKYPSKAQKCRLSKRSIRARMFWGGRRSTDDRATSDVSMLGTDRFMERAVTYLGCLIIAGQFFGAYVVYADDSFQPIYRAQGNIRYEQGVRGGSVSPHFQDSKFDFAQDLNGRWKLTLDTELLLPQKQPFSSTEVISYDGTNIYSVVYSDLLGAKGSVVGKKADIKAHPARISVGPYPVDYGPTVGLVWLAFTGARYLDTNETKKLFPNLLVGLARTDVAAWSSDFYYILREGAGWVLIQSGEYRLNPAVLAIKSKFCYELDEAEDDGGLAVRKNSARLLLDSKRHA